MHKEWNKNTEYGWYGQIRKEKDESREMMNKITGYGIGDEGAKVMSEMLKVNSTLTELDIWGEEEEGSERRKKREKKNE